jgi:hypothetical protein
MAPPPTRHLRSPGNGMEGRPLTSDALLEKKRGEVIGNEPEDTR